MSKVSNEKIVKTLKDFGYYAVEEYSKVKCDEPCVVNELYNVISISDIRCENELFVENVYDILSIYRYEKGKGYVLLSSIMNYDYKTFSAYMMSLVWHIEHAFK